MSSLQRVCPYNSHLPYSDSVGVDAEKYLEAIKINLKEAVGTNDLRSEKERERERRLG
jgi:hypothetical protein